MLILKQVQGDEVFTIPELLHPRFRNLQFSSLLL